MYKIQMAFQKIACFLAVIAGAVCFVYSLGMMTDLYDSLYFTMRDPKNLTKTQVPGSIIYYDMQDFNKLLLYFGIALILLGGLLFLTQTHARRRYYVGNVVSTVLFGGCAVGVTVWSHLQIEAYKTQFLTTVDFDKLAKFAKAMKSPYIDNTLWFDLHYVMAALLLIATVVLVINLVWKFRLMASEKALVVGQKEVVKA